MIEYEQDSDSSNIEISNVADWMRFNNSITEKVMIHFQ